MPSLPYEIREFNGLLPGLDRKRVDTPYVVEGRNFLVDLDGPITAFGREWVMHKEFADARGLQTLRGLTANSLYYMCHDSIQAYDFDARQLYPVFRHATRQEYWPWTAARVGNSLFMVNKEVGLVEYNRVTGVFRLITGTYIPATLYACTASGGRLILLSDDSIAWSEIDNGTADGFIPSTNTGAGAQALSIVSAAAEPLYVLSYAGGFLTYTTMGILQSERVTSANPFRHRMLSDAHVAINPWCIIPFVEEGKNLHLVLTRRGFYTTDGIQAPTQWEPIMSEFLHSRLFTTMSTNRTDMTLRIDYNNDYGWLTVAVSRDNRPAIYTYTYVHYVPSKKWGVYSRQHLGFIELYMGVPQLLRYVYGTAEADSTVYRFASTDSDRQYPTWHIWHLDYKTDVEIPAQYAGIDETSIMPSFIKLTADSLELLVDEAGTYDARYAISESVTPATMPVEEADTPVLLTGTYYMRTNLLAQLGLLHIAAYPTPYSDHELDAYVVVGPLRADTEPPPAIDSLLELQDLYVGMLEGGLADTIEDYIRDYSTDEVVEDWNLLSGVEDYGVGAGNNTSYKIELIGTIDGYNAWSINDYTHYITPELVAAAGYAKQYAGTVQGLFNYAKFTADEVGEAFHLKFLRHQTMIAGQYY